MFPSREPANDRALLDAGYRYALSLRAAPPDAEDLVQEAWFRLLRRYRSVRDKALLFRTIRNIYIDQYRRDRIALVQSMTDMPQAAPAPDTAELAIEVADLEAPLASLRPEEREALFLSAVEQYTASEIAKMTGRPRGTVLSLVHRARNKLRKALAPHTSASAQSS
ncbi:MAG: RNA polymerase sigma factor [Gammaproteobacteria bacterium]